jgi:hypothetical protein
LLSGHDVVMQVSAAPGWQSVAVAGLKPLASGNARVEFIDALSGTASAQDNVALAWDEQALKIRFKVPDRVNGADNKPPRHLAYIVVRGVA